MYRTIIKTQKNTQYKCLRCKHCYIKEDNSEAAKGDFCIVECKAENKPWHKSFDAKWQTCKEWER